MTAATKRKKIYCFDTSAFLALSQTDERVIKIDRAIWGHLEKMMDNGVIVSHEIVFQEIMSGTKNPSFIIRWLGGRKKYFLPKSDLQILQIPEIVQKFPGLIDYERETEQADPWLIALAIERRKKPSLFGIFIPLVVSQENQNSPKKIPAACKYFKVGHDSLREFFDEIGLQTKILKK